MKVEVTGRGFTARGHAGWGEAGTDIVCAGISAILQTTALGITEVLGLPAELVMEDGRMVCQVTADPAPSREGELALLLQTMVKGLESLEMAYPGHIEIDLRR